MNPLRCLGTIVSASTFCCATLAAQEGPPPRTDRHDHGHPAPAEPPAFRLLDTSLDLLFSLGTSNMRDPVLADLQAGEHDPQQRGFNFQQLEVGFDGQFDDVVRTTAALSFAIDADGETEVEVEEAFARSLTLPVELKGGWYQTEFGSYNRLHPHDWLFVDKPIAHVRVLGAHGLRGAGASVGYRVPDTGLSLLAGMQNARGDGMAPFFGSEESAAEHPVGGRFFVEQETRSLGDFLWYGRAAFAPDDGGHGLVAGASLAFGPNSTGGDSDTWLAGIDLSWTTGARGDHGLPGWQIGGEFLYRRYEAAAQVDLNDPLLPGDDVPIPGDTLVDRGFWLQAVHGCSERVGVGLRGEWADGSGASYDAEQDVLDSAGDPFRNRRVRVSPLLLWQAGDATRLRLQYNWDHAEHLTGDAHTVWLTCEFRLGGHHH